MICSVEKDCFNTGSGTLSILWLCECVGCNKCYSSAQCLCELLSLSKFWPHHQSFFGLFFFFFNSKKPLTLSIGQSSCRHSIAFLKPFGWTREKKSRWCEIDDLNTSSINAAANVLFGDWWRIQAIHLSYQQLTFKILLRFSMYCLYFFISRVNLGCRICVFVRVEVEGVHALLSSVIRVC